VTLPIASLSLDLDNLWSYKMTHGDADWDQMDTYLPTVIPRIVRLIERIGRPITVFVVGADAARPEHHELLQSLVAAGCELGNHSFHHQPWLHRFSADAIDDELSSAAEAIEQASGYRPVGFRGPGYSVTPDVLRTLVRQDYRYDASTLPTVVGPVARAIYFRSTDLSVAQREERSELFGHTRDGLASLRPYRLSVEADGSRQTLLELPVTTLPIARVPIHLSYVLTLGQVSQPLARQYFARALDVCRLRRVDPSILLHPLDLLGAQDVDALKFFPGMSMPLRSKLSVLDACLDLFVQRFDVRTMVEHARHYDNVALPVRSGEVIAATTPVRTRLSSLRVTERQVEHRTFASSNQSALRQIDRDLDSLSGAPHG
jgi:peptidoglycan-N-acetylglucosamine deacetylase